MSVVDLIPRPEGSASEAPSVFCRHHGPVTGVARVPGSQLAVTSAYDGAVGAFDLASGEVSLLGYHRHLVNRIVVDATGALAATCSSDYTVCLWDLASRRPLRTLEGHYDDVEDFIFVDRHTGVSASRDRRVLIWDLDTGAVRQSLEGHEKDVLSLAYHDGKIYSSGDDMTLRVWDLETGEALQTWGPFETETDTCAIDPGHRRAVLGCDDGYIRIFDTGTGELVREVAAHSSGIKKVAVSPKTGDILSAAYDQRMIVWDAESLAPKHELETVPGTWERSLTWSPSGDQVLGGTFDGTVLVWGAEAGRLEKEIGRLAHPPGNACINEVAACGEGEVALVADDGLVRTAALRPGHDALLHEVAPASGRRLMNAVTAQAPAAGVPGRVITGAHDHKIHLFDLTTDGLVERCEVALGNGPINTIRIAAHPGFEGEAFVGCYSSAIMRVSAGGEIRGRIQVHEGAVKALRLHPRETLGVSCGADGLLLSWGFDGKLRREYRGHTAIINDVDLAPDGERLVSVSRDFTAKVFEVASGRLLHSIPIGQRSLKSVCFWDEETLVIGDYWGGVIRVDLGSETYARSVVAQNGISSVARLGKHVAASSYDGSVYLVRPEDLAVVRALKLMQQRLEAA